MSDLKSIDKQYVANTYNRFPVQIVSGKGSLVFDENGKRYIDMGTGIAVNSFGVADDVWQVAVTAQLAKVQHTSNLYYTEPCARLAKMLCSLSAEALLVLLLSLFLPYTLRASYGAPFPAAQTLLQTRFFAVSEVFLTDLDSCTLASLLKPLGHFIVVSEGSHS